jgi:hypothetical protein
VFLCRSVLLLALATFSVAARANGRFPSAQHVVVGPGTASDVVALRVTFGLLISRDGGRTFRWLCEEGMYAPASVPSGFDPAIELSSNGDVVFAADLGVRATRDGCTVRRLEGAHDRAFSDLVRTPDGALLYALESTQGFANAVYRATGDARTLTRNGVGLTGYTLETIEVAPSNTRRLYVTGRDTFSYTPRLFRSDDAGETLTEVMTDAAPSDGLWLSAVHPRDPDTLYVRASQGVSTLLLRSRDGGRSFRRIARSDDPMVGFALSGDGRTVWYGSARGGLHRSDDEGDSFRAVSTLPILCLREHQGTLWACSDWTLAAGFALGRSRDGGASFEASLRFDNEAEFLGAAMCASASEGVASCATRWPALRDVFRGMPPDAGARQVMRRDASLDGTLDGGVTPREGGDGCAVTPHARKTSWSVLTMLWCAWAMRRSRQVMGASRGCA